MIKGFAITPIVVGRIAIGEIVEQPNGKRLPKKLDHMVLTKMHQVQKGWAIHPEMERLIQAQKDAQVPHAEQLRSIPVRIMFDKPENNFRSEYTCFDNEGRTVCSGNGEKAKRRDGNGVQDTPCPGADICAFGQQNRCKPFGRLITALENSFENDPLSGFMFRTTSFNSIRTLTFRLDALAAATGGKMAGMPCNLVMKAKSTSASFGTPIYYLDLEPVGGLVKAAQAATKYHDEFEEAGLNRDALEEVVSKGIEQSAFFEGGDDGAEVVEEFYQATGGDSVEGEDKGIAGAFSQGSAEQEHAEVNCASTLAHVKEIERLLELSGKDQSRLMDWLGKTAETGLYDLTPEEAERSIQVLQPKPAVEVAAVIAAAAEGAATPATAEVVATPAAVEVVATPAAVEVVATPAAVEVVATPAAVEVAATPAAVEVAATPAAVEVAATPAAAPEVVEVVATPAAAPEVVEVVATPEVAPEVAAPAVAVTADVVATPEAAAPKKRPVKAVVEKLAEQKPSASAVAVVARNVLSAAAVLAADSFF